ncbi:MAG: hypothetical protein M3R04_07570 [bacterium]|nr:hypothetical protein [bacterium]
MNEQAVLWQAMTHHRFLLGMADTSITAEQFGRWLQQDYLYVEGLINYIGQLIAKAPPHLYALLGGAVGAFGVELELFRQQARKLSIDLKPVDHAPACFNYLRFLEATGYSKQFFSMLVVLWTVEKAYYASWLLVRESCGDLEQSPWKHFINQWSSPQFGAWIDSLAEAIDALAESTDRAELQEASKLCGYTIRYEWLFWELAFEPQEWPI